MYNNKHNTDYLRRLLCRYQDWRLHHINHYNAELFYINYGEQRVYFFNSKSL